jgi:D-tyrosyl-tRNA(Tyr) deacylase
MRLLIQRVGRASVEIEGNITGKIGRGFLVLCGFNRTDSGQNLPKLANKCLNLRVFENNAGKMNLSLLDIKGELLVISQFTLYANCSKGRRPGFDESMAPDDAEKLYQGFIKVLEESGLNIQTGVFGAKMKIDLTNDGPVTIMLDSETL